MVETEVNIGTLYRYIRVMLAHLPGSHAKAGNLLPGPHHLDKVGVERPNQVPQRPAKRAKLGPRTTDDVFKAPVGLVGGHILRWAGAQMIRASDGASPSPQETFQRLA